MKYSKADIDLAREMLTAWVKPRTSITGNRAPRGGTTLTWQITGEKK